MKYKNSVGIMSYGTALPKLAIAHSEIDEASTAGNGVLQKTVPELDQDSATLATAAAYEAVQGLRKLSHSKNTHDPIQDIHSLFVGSESHPYAVKPTGTIVSAALGLSPHMSMANLEFACKAGTQALQIGLNYIAAGMGKYSLAIGSDTAQAEPGDALEFTAGAGSAAYIVGSGSEVIAKVLATTSYATDTPDFWRRARESYPQHAGRFTGEPAYFKHVEAATRQLMEENKINPKDIRYCVFHTPNAVFPVKVAKRLGFTKEQVEPSLIVRSIGNTYSAASLLALAAVLDVAKPGEKIVVTSYGSGAGADSFLLQVTDRISEYRKQATKSLKEKVSQLERISYAKYLHHMEQHV
jgi:hydroxymethylglutaryl-CoA synthase